MRPANSFTRLDLSCPRCPRHKAYFASQLPSRRLRAACGLLTIGVLCAGLTSPVRAADVRWKLNQDGLWNVAANWDTGVVPGTVSADDVFNDFSTATITFNTNATINRFLSEGAFNLNGGTLTGSQANSASTLRVNNVFTFDGGGLSNFTVNQGTGGSVVFTGNGSNYISNVIFKSDVNMGNGFADVYNTGNQFNGVSTFSGGHLRLRGDNNGVLTVGSSGSIKGYGLIDSFGGGTLTNNGTIEANGGTLTVNVASINGNGTFQATNNGILSIGGFLTGDNITVHADAGTVQVDGGTLSGSIANSTGTGISFSSSSSNLINNAVVNGNMTFGTGASADVYNTGNVLNGTASFSGGHLRLRGDYNGVLTVGSSGSIVGYGLVDSFSGGTLTNNGTINANSNGNILRLAPDTINGSGTFAASNGGMLFISGFLTGNNANVSVDNNPASRVLVDGGGIGGSIGSTTGTGISFSSSSNNLIDNVVVSNAARITLATEGFADLRHTDNVLNGTGSFSGGHLRLRGDYNGVLTVGSSGSIVGYGLVDSFSGGTLTNNGTINANSNGNILRLAPDTINGSGTFAASNGGMLFISGFLTGNNANVSVDNNPASRVLVDGGGIGGSIGSTTGTGISFSSSSSNLINNAVVNGNLTFGNTALADVQNTGNQFNGVSTFSGGHLRLRGDYNGVLTVGSSGSIVGYGLVDSFSGGTLTNNGTINANSNSLTLAPSTNGSGTFAASNGGILSISGFLTGNNANVSVDNNPASRVLVDGGGIGGSFASATGTGISFSSSSSNLINNAVVNGNMTFGTGASADVYNTGNVLNGTASFSGGHLRLRGDYNGVLTVGSSGSIVGYGLVDSFSGGTLTNNGTIEANVSGQTLTVGTSNFTNNGTTEATNGATLTASPNVNNTGNLFVASGSAGSFNGGVTQTAGQTRIDGTATLGAVFAEQGGVVEGNGTITGNISNTGGTITAGSDAAAGHLTVGGNYTQSAGGATLAKLGGTAQGSSFDLLSVFNTATLQGALNVQLVNGFNPFVGETFDFLTYQNRVGAYDAIMAVNNGYTYSVTYNDGAGIGTLHVTAAAVPETGTLVSLSLLALGAGWSLRRMKRQAN